MKSENAQPQWKQEPGRCWSWDSIFVAAGPASERKDLASGKCFSEQFYNNNAYTQKDTSHDHAGSAIGQIRKQTSYCTNPPLLALISRVATTIPWPKRKPRLCCCQAAKKRQNQERIQDFLRLFLEYHRKYGRSSVVQYTEPPLEVARQCLIHCVLRVVFTLLMLCSWQLSDRFYSHQLIQGNIPRDL